MIGHNEVVASDILPSMVDGMSQCLESMKARSKPLPVTPLLGDICKLDLPDASFDGIFFVPRRSSMSTISGRCSMCATDCSSPVATAVIANDSNRYNAAARAHSWKGWTERDEILEARRMAQVRGPARRACRRRALRGHAREVIRAAAPELDDSSVASFALPRQG